MGKPSTSKIVNATRVSSGEIQIRRM